MSPSPSSIPAAVKLCHDPWSLGPDERLALRDALRESQSAWLRVLADLVEPPRPDGDFPAFLLDTPPFARLRDAIGSARSAADLDTATADELQRFVDRYRGYLTAGAAP